MVDSDLRSQLISCWVAVTNTGGAAGFPFPPVDAQDVAPVLDRILEWLAPDRYRLVLASADGVLMGWLGIRHDLDPLVAHWGTLNHVQSHPDYRGRGVGSALVEHARHVARDEMGLEQLHLSARAGLGLEDFYSRLGWREIGRWPGALRLGPGDDRDEILMVLEAL
jgi:GNAT superfamily N-acetyltransferase